MKLQKRSCGVASTRRDVARARSLGDAEQQVDQQITQQQSAELFGQFGRSYGHPFEGDGAKQVYSINVGQISSVTGVPLAGSYLQLVEDQPGGLRAIPLPHLDAGPFLSYGIQWIAFGIIAPIGHERPHLLHDG